MPKVKGSKSHIKPECKKITYKFYQVPQKNQNVWLPASCSRDALISAYTTVTATNS